MYRRKYYKYLMKCNLLYGGTLQSLCGEIRIENLKLLKEIEKDLIFVSNGSSNYEYHNSKKKYKVTQKHFFDAKSELLNEILKAQGFDGIHVSVYIIETNYNDIKKITWMPHVTLTKDNNEKFQKSIIHYGVSYGPSHISINNLKGITPANIFFWGDEHNDNEITELVKNIMCFVFVKFKEYCDKYGYPITRII